MSLEHFYTNLGRCLWFNRRRSTSLRVLIKPIVSSASLPGYSSDTHSSLRLCIWRCQAVFDKLNGIR